VKNPIWAYGLLTVPERRYDLFPITLKSLIEAGFHNPTLFVDGDSSCSEYELFSLPVVTHNPPIRIVANWMTAAWQLLVCNPQATHFALFQDDVLLCKGVRQYIEQGEYPKKAYLNLCNYKENEELADGKKGWYPSNQKGRGAQALVFSRHSFAGLLGTNRIAERALCVKNGWRNIDGGVSLSANALGYTELVHMPSLAEHIGTKSTIGNSFNRYPGPETFPGTAYNVFTGAHS